MPKIQHNPQFPFEVWTHNGPTQRYATLEEARAAFTAGLAGTIRSQLMQYSHTDDFSGMDVFHVVTDYRRY